MSCLTAEQLAQAALGMDEGVAHTTHVEQCEACRAKLAVLRQGVGRIATAHAKLDNAHVMRRTELLASLANIEVDTTSMPTRNWTQWRTALSRLTPSQRLTGSLGVSAAIAILLLMVFVMDSTTSLSAMERMVQQLQDVKSYSYNLLNVSASKPGAQHHPLTIQRTDNTSWKVPDASQPEMLGSMRAEMKIVHTKGTHPTAENTRTTVHIEEVYPSGKPGLFINYLAKTYFRTPPATAEGVPADSPLRMLQIVREDAGDVVADLGTKRIDGKLAHGYAIRFKRAIPFRTLDSVEVWIDLEADLPIEFSYKAENESKSEIFKVYDCRWNIAFEPGHFSPTPPVGYDDITPPNDQQAIDEITVALKLYAELSGGHYPLVTEFDAEAIRGEMLKMAGFHGQPQPTLKEDKRFNQIEQASVGLNWIARILRRKHHSGYYGAMINAHDKNKALLWWTVDAADSYRIIYGDLQSELLPVEDWAKLVPSEVADGHLPIE